MSATAAWLAPALMIASGSVHAVVNAILKGGRDRMAGRALIDGSSALAMLPALAFVPLPTGAWGWLFASGLVHAVYLYALVRAFDLADFSAAYPILRGIAPMLTAAIAIGLLGEPATPADIAGIVVIGVATALLVAGRHIGRAGLGWALLTGAMIATYTVLDAQGVRAAPTAFSYIAWVFVTMGTGTALMFLVVSRGRILRSARSQWRTGVAAGMLSIVTYSSALYAFSLGSTAPLAALRETGMVTALLIATFVLRERVTPIRVVSVLGIATGAALILAG